MTSPKITIITISFNAEKEIEETMLSVLNQTYPNIEYLIIDGASKDHTIDIAKSIKAKYAERQISIVSEPDQGLYDAMNKGIYKATGSWCAFMNCGDVYDNDMVIERMYKSGAFTDEYKIVYGNTIFIYQDGTQSMHKTANNNFLKSAIHKYQPYCHQSAFFSLTNKSDCMFDTRYRIAADYDVCCRVFNKYGADSFHYVNQVVARYKAYDGVSSTNERKLKKEHILVKIRNRMKWQHVIKNVLSYYIGSNKCK